MIDERQDGLRRSCRRDGSGSRQSARWRRRRVSESTETFSPWCEESSPTVRRFGKVEARADVGEKLAVDELHGKDERRSVRLREAGRVRHAGGDTGDDRGPVHEGLQALRAARAIELGQGVGGRFEHHFVIARQCAVAQQVDDAVEVGARAVETRRIDAGVAEQRIGRPVVAVDDEDVLVVEEGREAQADEVMHPVGIKIVVELQDDIVGRCDVFEFMQHATSAVRDGLREEFLLLLQLDVVGALGRR